MKNELGQAMLTREFTIAAIAMKAWFHPHVAIHIAPNTPYDSTTMVSAIGCDDPSYVVADVGVHWRTGKCFLPLLQHNDTTLMRAVVQTVRVVQTVPVEWTADHWCIERRCQ
jgi:hypothetical protein